MTRAEIVAWSEQAGSRLTPNTLSQVPLSAKQRARVKELRWQAAEYSRKQQQMQQGASTPARAKRAAYGG